MSDAVPSSTVIALLTLLFLYVAWMVWRRGD
jgi:hypothetical protein